MLTFRSWQIVFSLYVIKVQNIKKIHQLGYIGICTKKYTGEHFDIYYISIYFFIIIIQTKRSIGDVVERHDPQGLSTFSQCTEL
jgi:hypothetical protein